MMNFPWPKGTLIELTPEGKRNLPGTPSPKIVFRCTTRTRARPQVTVQSGRNPDKPGATYHRNFWRPVEGDARRDSLGPTFLKDILWMLS